MSDPQKDAPAFDFFPERWLAGVAEFSDAEQLSYLRLLCHQWINQGLPEEKSKLKRLAGKGVSDALLEKFPIQADGKRRNGRLEEIREDQRARIASRRYGAAKTNQKRWGKSVAERSLSESLSTRERVAIESPPPTTHPVRDISIPAGGRAGVGAPCTVEQARAAAGQIMRPADLGEEWFHNRARAGWTYQPKAGPEKPINAANWRSDLAAWCGSVGDSRREKVYPKPYATTQRHNGAGRPSRNDGTLNDPSEYRGS